VAVSPNGRRVYVAGARRGPGLNFNVNIVLINPETDQVTPRVIDLGQVGFFGSANPPGPLPASVAATPDGGGLFVSDWLRLKVRRYTADASRELSAVDLQAVDVAAAPDGSGVYATILTCDQQDFTLFCRGSVAVLDSSDGSVVDRIDTTECEPYDFRTCIPGQGCPAAERCFTTGVAVTPDGNEVHVLDLHTDTLSVIDPFARQVVAEVPVPRGPLGIAIASIPGPCAAPSTPTPTATRTPSPSAVSTRAPTRTLPPRSPTSTPPPGICAADCDRSGSVTVAEIVRAVAIALGQSALALCAAADANGNLSVAIDELIAAVRAALIGCAAAPTPPAGSVLGTLAPCTPSAQRWSFAAQAGGALVVTVDTVAADTAADLCVQLDCESDLSAFADDTFDCRFPPPRFGCPRLEVALPQATSCDASVRSCSEACADPARADYELRVTLDGVPLPLQRSQ
jgi:YVTN family beta-propeller protein